MSECSLLQLKQQLKNLKTEKGIASKAVGDAKKSGDDMRPFIEDVQRISKQINELEKKIKDLSDHESTLKHDPVSDLLLPSQFKQRQLRAGQPDSIQVADKVSDQRWDDYVTDHPNATIYHTSVIRKVIENTFGHSSHYLAVEDISTHELQGVLPLIEMKSRLFGHFLISVPFFNYGGVLASTQVAELELLKQASILATKLGAQHIEYRHTDNHIDLPGKSEKAAMLLNLPDNKEELWSDIGTKVRAQIKRAQRNDVQVRTGGIEILNDFYRVFSQNMRDLGTPVYAKSFFYNMIKACPTAQIINIYLDGKPVSTGFVLGWRDTLEIPWASTIKSANKYDTNMLLYWEILKYAIQNQYQIFDFGRSSKNANTYRFKKQWGAKPHDLYWNYWLPGTGKLPEINPNNPKFRLMVSAWMRLPLPVANLIGPLIVKSIP